MFPLIKDDELWMGVTIHSGDREFRVPDHYPLNAAAGELTRTESSTFALRAFAGGLT